MKHGKTRTVLVAIVVAMTVAGAFAPAVTAEATDELNYTGDKDAPDPYGKADLTVSRVPMDEITNHVDVYYDDNGELVTDPDWEVNKTEDIEDGTNVNLYNFKPGWADDPDFGQFPRLGDEEDDDSTDAGPTEDNLASALDASEWTKSGSDSSTLTISDSSVAQGVEGVRIQTNDSWVAGSIATAQYSNWTSQLDSDESKRVLQLAVDVDTLDAGTDIQINVTDETGDEKTVWIDPDKTAAGNDNVLADATGDSFLVQAPLSDLTTNGAGSWDNIESIDIEVAGGDADVTFTWIDLESKGRDKLGTKVIDDADSDSDYDDEQDIYNATGAIDVDDMSTLGAEFEDATLNDVTFGVEMPVHRLDEEGQDKDYFITTENASDYPGFDKVLNASYRLEFSDAIDLSWANAEIELDQEWPSDRFIKFEIKEAAGDEDFDEIDDGTSLTSSLGAPGDEDIDLDTTITAGDKYALMMEVKYTQDEIDDILVSSDSDSGDSDAGGPQDQEPQGIFASIWAKISALIGAVLVAVGLKKRSSG